MIRHPNDPTVALPDWQALCDLSAEDELDEAWNEAARLQSHGPAFAYQSTREQEGTL